jgi:hypothetical protein
MNVPGWKNEATVNNEEWTAFGPNKLIEIGSEGGRNVELL